MSLKINKEIFSTVTFRLTIWYTGIFVMSSLIMFLVVYLFFSTDFKKRIDDGLINTIDEFETLYNKDGLNALKSEFINESKAAGIKDVFFELLSGRNKIVASSNLSSWPNLNNKYPKISPPKNKLIFQTISVEGHSHRVRVASKEISNNKILRVGTTLRYYELLMERYRETFSTIFTIMVFIGIIGGWLLAKNAMSGVQNITKTVTGIGDKNLNLRIADKIKGKEIEDLRDAFNNMLERIERAVLQIKEISDNVAHDLRSPITRIRGIAETTLTGIPKIDNYKEMASDVIEESDRMIEMINTLLEISKTDSGIAEFEHNPVNLIEIVNEAVILFKPMAEDLGISLTTEIFVKSLYVKGDRKCIQRAIANILDNSIKYTPKGGEVIVSVRQTENSVVIDISDTGYGISEKELKLIFNRFYRGDKSRSTTGSGLGLSLAQAFIHAHNGHINIESTPGKGSTFSIFFPFLLSG